MAKRIGKRTITVIRKPKVDRLSSASSAESRFDIEGCAVLPRSSNEEGRGWVIVEGKMVIAPFNADILPSDRILIPGDSKPWNVDGEPGDYENRRAIGKATIVYLTRQKPAV